MKKIILSLFVVIGLSVSGFSADMAKKPMKNFRAVPMEQVQILQKGKAKKFCPVCGMTLPMFYKTNHAADVDGETHQYCSIHCMLEEAMTKGIKVVNPRVIDNDTLKFIPAKDAFYVVGSSKPATMSMVSKYAFGSQKTATDFAKKFGGKIMKYDAVVKQVSLSLKKEIAMIKKRQAKAAKMGKKVYEKMCKATDQRFTNPALAKAYLKEHKLCGKLKGKPFQQVGLYLAGRAK
ncbi:nitrous oxide reductase accessory protein NosL [Sulfurospirillum arcachonense]|uniref:nitrous oxide reductase accessory protein NosL n=1 Tax=Sulfurospirillum arcachonense TaxID=57666 RepID=UPI0004693BB4|nr:nitrous oxide reductase accessory protein NosL [Sulfurospirillum arcachonense]